MQNNLNAGKEVQDMAMKMSGVQHGNEEQFRDELREKNMSIIFGYSDDCMEADGVMYDEYPVFDGGSAAILDECFVAVAGHAYTEVFAIWNDDKDGASWRYEAEFPHAEFLIFDGEELYCRGIVFSIDDLKL